jgi:pimeloyl-ACP methyl ester carboxylesterase
MSLATRRLKKFSRGPSSKTVASPRGMPEPQSGFLEVKGLRAHYLTAGEGKPLVLLHGSAIDSSRLSYGPSIAKLAKDYRVLAPDWPGYGRSEHPQRPYVFADYIAFLEGFLDGLSLEKVHLAGFSMGGGVALGFALSHPERLRKLVLVDSYGLGGEIHVPFLPYLFLRTPRLDSVVWGGLRLSRRVISTFLKLFVFADPRKVNPALVAEIREQLREPEVERAFMSWIRGEVGWRGLSTNYLSELSTLRVPTLLLHGARDLIIPASRARRAAKRIPRAQLVIVPRCGHWLPREARERFAREVLEFLRSPWPLG